MVDVDRQIEAVARAVQTMEVDGEPAHVQTLAQEILPELRMRAEVIDLMEEAGRIVGGRAKTPDGPLEVRADLIVGADGRHSIVREKAGLYVDELGAPMDVLWFRLSRHADDGEQTLGRITRGKMMVMLNRGDYWQCAYLIRKGDFDRIRQAGLPSFLDNIVSVAPFLRDRTNELKELG